jgi:DNA-binding transcriptional LysR family regulator
VISLDVRPSRSTNDAGLEVEAVLSGHAIGLLASLWAAPLIRSGQVVPLLTEHVADHLSIYVYYGSRAAQPSRVRSFIDFVVERLGRSSKHVLDARELAMAQAKGIDIKRYLAGTALGTWYASP